MLHRGGRGSARKKRREEAGGGGKGKEGWREHGQGGVGVAFVKNKSGHQQTQLKIDSDQRKKQWMDHHPIETRNDGSRFALTASRGGSCVRITNVYVPLRGVRCGGDQDWVFVLFM